MARTVQAFFTATNDKDFEPGFEEVILLAPDITLSINEGGMDWVFRTPINSVINKVDPVMIDLSTCGRLEIQFEEYNNSDLSPDFLANSSFVEVVRALMVNKKAR